MEPESEFPWHFDGNEFTISVLVQQAEQGGIFEYVPDIRRGEEKEKVEAILHGGEEGVRRLDLNPETSNSLKVGIQQSDQDRGGNDTLYRSSIVRIRSISNESAHHSINYYGAIEAHYERSKFLVDGLVD